MIEGTVCIHDHLKILVASNTDPHKQQWNSARGPSTLAEQCDTSSDLELEVMYQCIRENPMRRLHDFVWPHQTWLATDSINDSDHCAKNGTTAFAGGGHRPFLFEP